VHSQTAGRTVRTRANERYLQAARERQKTDEFKRLYRLRSAIERKLAELARHGIRYTRYLGATRRQLQRLWTAAAVNLKRLFKLAEYRATDLRRVLASLGQCPAGLSSA
jgi:uncharacterized protein HemY